MNVRWIAPKDMAIVLGIEQENFPDPWTRDDFNRAFHNKNCVGRILEDNNGEIVGYLVYEYDQVSYSIINLAVAKNKQRQGFGKTLMENLISHMENSAKGRMLATISDRNLAAQLFLRRIGFRAERISRDFFGPEHHGYEFVFLRTTTPNKQKDELCQGV